ncbi:hypothetical protein HDU67_002436 [Dinochytrium kinnereticum]|nr:hypothetical protein HDU67_002436 [Dinochytrium kinnereticum]
MPLPPLTTIGRTESLGLRRSSSHSVEAAPSPSSDIPSLHDAGRVSSFASVGTASSGSLRRMIGSGNISKLSKGPSEASMGREDGPSLKNISSSRSSFGSLKASLLKDGKTFESLDGRSNGHRDSNASVRPPHLSDSGDRGAGLYRSGGSRELSFPDDETEGRKSAHLLDRSPTLSGSGAGLQTIRLEGKPSHPRQTPSRSGTSSRDDNSLASTSSSSRTGSLTGSNASISRIQRSNTCFEPYRDLSLQEETSNTFNLEAIDSKSPAPALKSLRRANTPKECLPEDGRPSTTTPLKDLYDDGCYRVGRRQSSLTKQPSVAGLRRSEARASIVEGEHIRGKPIKSYKTANVDPAEIRRELSSSVNYTIQNRVTEDSSFNDGIHQRHASNPQGSKQISSNSFSPHAPKDPAPMAQVKSFGHTRRASMYASAETPKSSDIKRHHSCNDQRTRQKSEPPLRSPDFSNRHSLPPESRFDVKMGVESTGLASEVMEILAKNSAHAKGLQSLMTEEQKKTLRYHRTDSGELHGGAERTLTISDGNQVDFSEADLFYGQDTFESPRAHARHRWLFALQYTLKLVKATVLFRHMLPPHRMRMQELETMDSSDMETHGLTYMLKSHQSKADFVFSARVQSMLTGARTPLVLKTLQRLLVLRVRSFERFSDDQQKALCRVFTFESRSQGTVIVKEGQDPLGFYFIVSGQCEAYRTKNDKKYRINILNTGDLFGENRADGKRTYSVWCTMQSELLRVDAADYEMILHMNDSEYIASRVTALQKLPHFSNAHPSVLERMAQISQLHSFKPQQTIVKEGVENYLLYWIISGSCRAVKLVPFLKRRTTPECAVHSSKYTVVPYDPAKELQPEDEISMQLLNIRELSEGDHFPDMAAAINPERFNKIELMSRLSSDNPNRLDARAYISVITNTKVEVISMTRVDYARVATNDMILKIISDRRLLHIPITDLQTSVLQKREWDLYKKRYVERVAHS